MAINIHPRPSISRNIMERTTKIHSHPQRDKIDSMLDEGIPYALIARTVGGVSTAGIGRYSISRRSEIAKILAGEPGVTDILTRLVDASEHARIVRNQAKASGSPVAQSRAIKIEADLLSKLIRELGITDSSVTDAVGEFRAVITALKVFCRTYPDSAADLVQVLLDDPQTTPLGEALKGTKRKAS